MEPATPVDILRALIFPISSLPELHERGSYEKAIAEMAVKGIRKEIEWCIQRLEEDRKNRKS